MLFMGMMSLDGPEDYGRLSDETIISEYRPVNLRVYPVYCKESPGCRRDHAGDLYKGMDFRCGLQVPGEAAGMDVYHSQESMLHEVSQSEA